jgi:hypothetical protein
LRGEKLGIVGSMRINAQAKVLTSSGASIGWPGRGVITNRSVIGIILATPADDHFEMAMITRPQAQNGVRCNYETARQQNKDEHTGGVSY